MIAITLASIVGIALAVWVGDKFLPVKVCPVCAGGFLTWTWLLVMHYIGYPVPLTIPAILMGGSVVGIMYQIDRRSPRGEDARMLFKVAFLGAGFLAAFALLSELLLVAGLALAFLVGLSYWAVPHTAAPRERTETEKRLEECCS